ncbi:basic salivary proline-rich protein 1-like [Canis lupus familiaris]|uniref:basic salivary proline-rich protein 1-like n=1 Tax=Canis lupus familiaris TaxID=9615 RepID=UPI0018F7BF38|nr:basic salivary proline-rich protein 1-like [Canis lupus familiaris]XP_048971026.1 basic salivary proline-rich protein 1-like [Canis lupus dingo]
MCLGGHLIGSGSLGTSPEAACAQQDGFYSDSGGNDGTDGCSSRGPQAPGRRQRLSLPHSPLEAGRQSRAFLPGRALGPKAACLSPKERFINRSGVSAAGKPSTRPPAASRSAPRSAPGAGAGRGERAAPSGAAGAWATGTAPGSRGLRRRLLKLWNPKTPRATAALAASGCGRGAGRDPPPPPPPPLPPPPAPRLRRARAPQAPPAPTRHTPTRVSGRPAPPAAPRRPPLSVRTRGAPATGSRLPRPAPRPPPSGSLRGRPGPACARAWAWAARPFPAPSNPLGRGAPSRGNAPAAALRPPASAPRLREALVPPRVTVGRNSEPLPCGGVDGRQSVGPFRGPGASEPSPLPCCPSGERRAGPSRRRRPLTPVVVTVQLPCPGPGPGPGGRTAGLVAARRPAGLGARGSGLARHSKWARESGLGSRTQERRERDTWRGAPPSAPADPLPAVAEALPAVPDGVDKRAVRGGCCVHLSPVQEEDCKPITGLSLNQEMVGVKGLSKKVNSYTSVRSSFTVQAARQNMRSADKDTLTGESIPEEANFDPRHKCHDLMMEPTSGSALVLKPA